MSLGASPRGGVYIVDNNAHAVRYWGPDSDSVVTFTPQDGAGALAWPTSVDIAGESVYVADNDGIKVFSVEGKFQRLLRVYYQLNYFTVKSDGRIYANPAFTKKKRDNPLIVELDGNGKRLRNVGKRFNGPDEIGLADQVFVRTSSEYIFAVYKHFPIVHVYDNNGGLVRDFPISHPAFTGLIALNKNRSFINPEPGKHRLARCASGARVVGDRLLILLDLPHPEIVEFNFAGQELNRYRAAVSPMAQICHDFVALRHGDYYKFWILFFGDRDKSVSLTELVQKE
jgi:hypothetical protein